MQSQSMHMLTILISKLWGAGLRILVNGSQQGYLTTNLNVMIGCRRGALGPYYCIVLAVGEKLLLKFQSARCTD